MCELFRFTLLHSLNLSYNNLSSFPLSVLELTNLVELNLGGNHLTEIPTDIDQLNMYDYSYLFYFPHVCVFVYIYVNYICWSAKSSQQWWAAAFCGSLLWLIFIVLLFGKINFLILQPVNYVCWGLASWLLLCVLSKFNEDLALGEGCKPGWGS